MELSGNRWRLALVAAVPSVAIAGLAYGRMPQDVVLPNFHNFADQQTFWGVPNFWNVVSNAPFLAVAALWLCGPYAPRGYPGDMIDGNADDGIASAGISRASGSPGDSLRPVSNSWDSKTTGIDTARMSLT